MGLNKWEVLGLIVLLAFGGVLFWLSRLDWDDPGLNAAFGVITGAILISFGVLLGAGIVAGASIIKSHEDHRLLQQDQKNDLETMREMFRIQTEAFRGQNQLALSARKLQQLEAPEDVAISVAPDIFEDLEDSSA